MLTTPRAKIVIAGLLLAGCQAALAQPAGNFVIVQNSLTGPGGAVASGQALVPGQHYRTSAGSAAKLILGGNTLISIGEGTEFRVEGGGTTTEIELTRGRLRAFVSPLASFPGQVEIRTPTVLTEVHDAEVLVDARGDGTCVVTAISGSPVVSIPNRPQTAVRLTGGQQVRASASGQIDTPTPVSRNDLDVLWASVEAVSSGSREIPLVVLRQWEVPTRSGGERLATDCISCPDRRTFDGRDIDPGPGAAAVTSGSKSGATADR